MGVAAYFRKFIRHFSDTSACLYNLLKKGFTYNWPENCETSFQLIKEQLQRPTSLHHPDFNKPFLLTTDASDKALGFTLLQEFDGELLPIIFGGRILSEAEKKYCANDKELLAVYFAVKRCEYYLIGHPFIMYTDHKPLIHLKAFKDIVNKRFRWIQYLESINTIVKYIPGDQNILSDYIHVILKKKRGGI